jgi:hypothetical protein
MDRSPSPEYHFQAKAIAAKLSSFAPSLRLGSSDSMSNILRITLQEIWRHTAWIHFHQSISHLPAHHDAVASSRTQLFDLLLEAERHLPRKLGQPFALCFFLAATVSISAGDRRRCRDFMADVGPHEAYRGNLAFIERLWWESDVAGNGMLDWREARESWGDHVAFM